VRHFAVSVEDERGSYRVLTRLTDVPIMRGNAVELLIDGDATFGSIFKGIEQAREYCLVQFFVIHDDDIGREFQRRLIAKAKDGVRVFVLYDEIGSHSLPRRYLRRLREAGVEVSGFRTTQGINNRFQLNFRNHRKIVVVDGQEAWVGGHNVGDEYLGRNPKFGHWRDTHIRIAGPAVLEVQLSFMEDWYWATKQLPSLNWEACEEQADDRVVHIIPSGPSDARETATLTFLEAITGARERVWIASPYFVPDEGVLCALKLADLRGVDVRILIPDNPDHVLVYLSAFTFLKELEGSGIGIYRY
ncbi:MAG: cardiolipin synthase, partial [bacterium]|nr:cardiolipin synthase [bacterium]